MSEKYSIIDIEVFIEKTRVMVYNFFGQSELPIDEVDMEIDNLEEEARQELDNCLSQKEAEMIAFEHLKKTKNKKGEIIYILSEVKFMKIIEDFTLRITSNILNSLAAKGLLNTAFDEETNDFVFWAKEDDKDTNNKA